MAAKNNWKTEVLSLSKAVLASLTIVGVLGSIVWDLWAKDLVERQVEVALLSHESRTIPVVNRNTEDVAQLKDLALQTHLYLKQLTTDEMEQRADKEFQEIKRRQ